jgi:hypothetical protein
MAGCGTIAAPSQSGVKLAEGDIGALAGQVRVWTHIGPWPKWGELRRGSCNGRQTDCLAVRLLLSWSTHRQSAGRKPISVTRAVMEVDGVDRQELEAMLRQAGRNLPPLRGGERLVSTSNGRTAE